MIFVRFRFVINAIFDCKNTHYCLKMQGFLKKNRNFADIKSTNAEDYVPKCKYS